MTRTGKVVAVTGVLAAVLLAGFAAQAGGGWAGGGHGPERMRRFIAWRVDDTLSELDATDAQRQAIHGIKDRLLADGERLMKSHAGAREELFTQLQSPTPDAKAVHALVDARLEAMRAFAHEAADAALQAHAVLTPAQRAQLAEELRAHAGRH